MPVATNNPPVASPAPLLLGVEDFLADIRARFVPNRYGQLDEQDFLAVFELAATVFADWRHLSVQRVKGATYPVPYTDNLELIPPDYRILGMQAQAVNGVDSAAGGAGVRADPVYFTLLRESTGPVNALLDAAPTTTLTVRARWVRLGGSVADLQDQFALLELEDHDYAAGDVVKWVFADGATRLLEWRADSVGFQHPVPTGADDDPVYAIFAPLTPATGGGAGLSSVQAQQLDDALPAPLAADGRTVSENLVLDVVTKLKNGRGFVGANTGAADRNFLQGNWELRAYNGADANYKAFANANGYAIVRKDYLVSYLQTQLPNEVAFQFAADSPAYAETIISSKYAGTYTMQTLTGALSVTWTVDGAKATLPITLVAGNILGCLPDRAGAALIELKV